MWRAGLAIALGIAVIGAVVVHTVFAQHQPTGSGEVHAHGTMPSHHSHGHAGAMHTMDGMAGGAPTMAGQDAFGAIAEIVRILDADPATDWTRVDLERLRQHLIDMNEVVLRSTVRPTPVPGGLAMEITGTGRTEQAIRTMVMAHALELDRMAGIAARTESLPGGVRLTVVTRSPDDAKRIARIRGLGFAGLMTEGAHHQAHHLAMARGDAHAGHAR